ncbi:hypothetical protein HPB47_020611 [Ixodes persulcatus]|uniref:Uncharacterized protein n=1 Tax=Ixodes persulcatus TaxID=34615 RepID=A0AC60QF76_IXOPE|nr:hypothetical protein HPB47_020611 [Ixodes persulcatus]
MVSSSRTVKHDKFTLNAIRLKVHRKYSERENPTLDSILEAVNEDDELPDLSKTTLWRLLKDIGFTFEKRKRRLALIERSDIIAWCRSPLVGSKSVSSLAFVCVFSLCLWRRDSSPSSSLGSPALTLTTRHETRRRTGEGTTGPLTLSLT